MKDFLNLINNNKKVIYAVIGLSLINVLMILIMRFASFPVLYPVIIALELVIHLICIRSIYNLTKNNKLIYVLMTFIAYMIISLLFNFIINMGITIDSLQLTLFGYLGFNIFHYIVNVMYILFNFSDTVPLVILNNIVLIVSIVIRVIYMLYHLIKKLR